MKLTKGNFKSLKGYDDQWFPVQEKRQYLRQQSLRSPSKSKFMKTKEKLKAYHVLLSNHIHHSLAIYSCVLCNLVDNTI